MKWWHHAIVWLAVWIGGFTDLGIGAAIGFSMGLITQWRVSNAAIRKGGE